MDSIADLLKSMPNSSLIQRAHEQSARLVHEPLIQELLTRHPEIDDAVIRVHMNRLFQYVKEAKHCANCPGLDECPNDLAGHYTRLSVETIEQTTQIYDRKVPCKKWIAKRNQEAIQKRIHCFYIDETALKEGYDLEEIIEKDRKRVIAVKKVMDYILLTKKSGLQKRGLYLTGPFGTGKTFLMCYMLHELAKEGWSGAIVYMPDFIEELKSLFSEPGKIKEMIDVLKHVDLLIFDDIGAENLNPWVRDHVLGAIINYRMNRKPTFYTSNFDLDSLEKHFSFTNKDGDEEYKGMRIMDRIRPFVDVVIVDGTNKRGT